MKVIQWEVKSTFLDNLKILTRSKPRIKQAFLTTLLYVVIQKVINREYYLPIIYNISILFSIHNGIFRVVGLILTYLYYKPIHTILRSTSVFDLKVESYNFINYNKCDVK